MSEEDIRTFSADEVTEMIARGESKTDWARVAALTDEEIMAAMKDDPDWAEFMDVDWSKATIVYPTPKKAVSIRLDEDVIDFFKKSGKGYQTRMNAVLRHFMTEQKNRKNR
ncbi:BrnA antitoxin family protein [Pararhizobium sp. YC-54]|uniref:BrnA antitoxin family protein n=1 Tax=Pararhizobium sp. YC-54 TaxID=2986920 RepID=UPI0021F6F10C|nr:BrnA antitoxin family protein [Pararhizobium sp. YC-54]MCV9999967.1 BrnA antitoxin family protein [Pararhizobium sp. YC-54]